MRSTTGFLMMMNSAPTSCEYYGIHERAKHCLWYKNFSLNKSLSVQKIADRKTHGSANMT
ncbi:hypothetical protein PIROE2DRAFT_11034 [Piromyces sp. E2]|nr:hypothetical protein PIROE2DRAFT_11034 [Piromyces sp. E2]|eukprot:OUM62656.1 hypothetical protein PIROE2DRAFT_11034 [Piromyces sp. E2]